MGTLTDFVGVPICYYSTFVICKWMISADPHACLRSLSSTPT